MAAMAKHGSHVAKHGSHACSQAWQPWPGNMYVPNFMYACTKQYVCSFDFRARLFGGLLAQTPEELYDLIPTILPQERTCLRKAVAADFWPGQDKCSGVYKLNNEEVLLSLPTWTWVHVRSFYRESDLFETHFKAVDSEVVEG